MSIINLLKYAEILGLSRWVRDASGNVLGLVNPKDGSTIVLGNGANVALDSNRNCNSDDNLSSVIYNATVDNHTLTIIKDTITKPIQLQQESTGTITLAAGADVTFIGTSLSTTGAGSLLTVLPTSTSNKYIVRLVAGCFSPQGGADLVLLIGQSNMAGRGTYNAGIDTTDPKVSQFDGYTAGATYRTLIQAADRLKHPEIGVQQPGVTLVGPGMFFGKSYAASTGRNVILIPAAWGGTALGTTTAPWNPYGTNNNTPPAATGQSVLYWNAINEANRAITAALATIPNSKFAGILWLQGEQDGTTQSETATITYTQYLKDIIAGCRANIIGASDAWFIIGSMLPEAIASNANTLYNGLPDPKYQLPVIDRIHKEVAASVSKCAFSYIGSGYDNGDKLHYNAAGARLMGSTMASLVNTAEVRTTSYAAGQVTNLNTYGPSDTSVTLKWKPPSSGGIVSDYLVEYSSNGGSSWSTFNKPISTLSMLTVTGLTASTSYQFRVSAVGAGGTGVASNVASASTVAAFTVSTIRLATLTGMTEGGDTTNGYTYSTLGTVAGFASHGGASDKKLPATVDGGFSVVIGNTSNLSTMLGVMLSQVDSTYSDATYGYKFGEVDTPISGTIRAVTKSSTSSAPVELDLARSVGDIMRIRRASGVWCLELAKAASPTVFNVLNIFEEPNNADVWLGLSLTSTFGAKSTGVVKGFNVV